MKYKLDQKGFLFITPPKIIDSRMFLHNFSVVDFHTNNKRVFYIRHYDL